ncbi:DUF2155 domain-containing protein [Ovoidimarina sediminis]|uniref:DUF2155 domain-containing protein n=1 Tax=Ovoidimarina sediminis TaxID=3079856 RepID=UPI00290DC368|nr:DUF2155 domain-containing protein [Rhodophyticola sp. MJ-SS7]MDU8945086.1 DUF2155 domain-containing protein [Rhodophyticola sp. MJ-SS7]
MRRLALLLLVLAAPAAAQNFGVTEESQVLLPDFSEPVLDADGNEIIGGGIVVEELQPMQSETLSLARPRQAPVVRVEPAETAVLRSLDKVTGIVKDLELSPGETAAVGRLTVALKECRVPAGNPTGDAYAYLTVTAEGLDAPAFSGWMVASSPALSALDHPRYDVWVIRCRMS